MKNFTNGLKFSSFSNISNRLDYLTFYSYVCYRCQGLHYRSQHDFFYLLELPGSRRKGCQHFDQLKARRYCVQESKPQSAKTTYTTHTYRPPDKVSVQYWDLFQYMSQKGPYQSKSSRTAPYFPGPTRTAQFWVVLWLGVRNVWYGLYTTSYQPGNMLVWFSISILWTLIRTDNTRKWNNKKQGTYIHCSTYFSEWPFSLPIKT